MYLSDMKNEKTPAESRDPADDFDKASIRSTKEHEIGGEMRHQFSVWSLASLCLCTMATWEAVASVVSAALTSGGAPCLFYNYIVSFLCSVCVAASLAEIASMYPTAGGQYHWVALLAPENKSKAPSWFTAWISIGAQIVFNASAAFAAGLQMQGMVVLNNPDYAPQRWHGLLLYWLVLLYSVITNLWGAKLLAKTNLGASVLHIAGFAAIMIVLGVMAPKNDAYYVFVETQNASGWQNDGVAWLVGLVSSVYPFLGYDAAVHLSEEMDRPARNVPLAMVGSVVVNGILGLGFCLMLLFSLTNLEDLLQTATGFPAMQLFINVTGNIPGATILSLILSLAAVVANSAGLTSASRTAWAFARDLALPFSEYFAHIDSKLEVPVRMVVLQTILQMLLGFLYLGSITAYNAVLSMAILGFYASYLLPIVYMLLYGRGGNRKHIAGPFRLGKIGGIVLNSISIIWLVFAGTFSTFPSYMPVTSDNMNYSTTVMGAWLIFGAMYYFVWGRKKYEGPVIEVVSVAASMK